MPKHDESTAPFYKDDGLVYLPNSYNYSFEYSELAKTLYLVDKSTTYQQTPMLDGNMCFCDFISNLTEMIQKYGGKETMQLVYRSNLEDYKIVLVKGDESVK